MPAWCRRAGPAHEGREMHVPRRRVPKGWSPAKRAPMDADGRWTLRSDAAASARQPAASSTNLPDRARDPGFWVEEPLGIHRRHGFIRRFVITDAARHDGRHLGQLLDPYNAA